MRSSRSASAVRDLPAKIVRVDYRDTSSLISAFDGAEAVVHLAGALQPRRGESLYDANVGTTSQVVMAAQSARVRRLVYLSAPGASPHAANDYLRTKGIAEDAVRAGDFQGAILRVPMVLGPGSASFETLRHMATARFVPLVMGGKVRVQPIAQEDVVRAIHWALTDAGDSFVALDLVGPETIFYVDLLRKVSERLGTAPRVFALPKGLVEASAHAAGWLPALGWNSSLFDTLFNEHLADASAAQAMLPFELTRLDELFDQLLETARPDPL